MVATVVHCIQKFVSLSNFHSLLEGQSGYKIITFLYQMLSEGNARMINITGDEALDVVIPFGTGADGYDVPDGVCDVYFGGQKPCFGGVVALDGKTGDTLWTQWSKHEVFALTCQGDLNRDNITDCVAGGRAGVSHIHMPL